MESIPGKPARRRDLRSLSAVALGLFPTTSGSIVSYVGDRGCLYVLPLTFCPFRCLFELGSCFHSGFSRCLLLGYLSGWRVHRYDQRATRFCGGPWTSFLRLLGWSLLG